MYCETQNGSNIVNIIRDIEIAFAISWIKNLVKKIAANNLLWRQIDVATQFVKEKKEMTMKNIQRDNQHLVRRLIVHKMLNLIFWFSDWDRLVHVLCATQYENCLTMARATFLASRPRWKIFRWKNVYHNPIWQVKLLSTSINSWFVTAISPPLWTVFTFPHENASIDWQIHGDWDSIAHTEFTRFICPIKCFRFICPIKYFSNLFETRELWLFGFHVPIFRWKIRTFHTMYFCVANIFILCLNEMFCVKVFASFKSYRYSFRSLLSLMIFIPTTTKSTMNQIFVEISFTFRKWCDFICAQSTTFHFMLIATRFFSMFFLSRTSKTDTYIF